MSPAVLGGGGQVGDEGGRQHGSHGERVQLLFNLTHLDDRGHTDRGRRGTPPEGDGWGEREGWRDGEQD